MNGKKAKILRRFAAITAQTKARKRYKELKRKMRGTAHPIRAAIYRQLNLFRVTPK